MKSQKLDLLLKSSIEKSNLQVLLFLFPHSIILQHPSTPPNNSIKIQSVSSKFQYQFHCGVPRIGDPSRPQRLAESSCWHQLLSRFILSRHRHQPNLAQVLAFCGSTWSRNFEIYTVFFVRVTDTLHTFGKGRKKNMRSKTFAYNLNILAGNWTRNWTPWQVSGYLAGRRIHYQFKLLFYSSNG